LATLITWAARAVTAPQRPARRVLTKALAAEALAPSVTVETDAGPLAFTCPTARAAHDPLNFGRDEPETLWWIATFIAPGQCLWDVGANIGLYALYAARRAKAQVLAFEPSAATFAALVRNIELNGLGAEVEPLCLALAERTGLDRLYMAESGAGHSMHGFGTTMTAGGAIAPRFAQAALGFTIDALAALPGVRRPDHLKLDVDGIEAAILRGAGAALRTIETVLVEDSRAADGAETPVGRLLNETGYAETAPPQGSGRNRIFRRR
jgi:FkbM family methyltransferase